MLLDPLALFDLPGFEARGLGFSLLFELRQHQIEARNKAALLIRKPPVHAAVGLRDRAIEAFAPGTASRLTDRLVQVLRPDRRSARRLVGRGVIRVGIRSLV